MDTLVQLFTHAVKHFSSRVALLEPTGATADSTVSALSYQTLQERVHTFAGYLQQQGVNKGDRLIIWSASRSNWLIAYFGALLTGMIIVPLDVNTRQEFLARIAETTEAKFVVTTQKQYQGLQQTSIPFIDIDTLPSGSLDLAQLPSLERNDLAEVVFTSGTTGQPKGVMLSHYNIVSNALAALQVIDIRTEDRALSILPLSHMFEMTVEIALLRTGASIVYARTLVPDTLLKLLSSQHVTCMVLVPQALQLFLNGIEREVRRQKKEKQWEQLHWLAARLPFGLRRSLFGAVHKRFGGHFRFFVSGGAYLPPPLTQRWEDMGFRVIQGYGATECSPVITATPFHAHNLESVGKPLPGVEVRIAADKEILVHGPNVFQGYWKNSAATEVALQEGWYHTGDLGFLDAQDNLYLKGRKKNLIVLANGMNVYPEDLENVLRSIPGVKDAVVFGLMEDDAGPQVHSILLLEEPEKAKTVVQQANKRLAAHQQIRGFTVWPHQDFPKTHTLKVKRQDVLDALSEIRGK
jgi:long-chain acyl-CoA synthetase